VEFGSLSAETFHDLGGFDRIGVVTADRTPLSFTPPTEVGQHRSAGDSALGPMIDSVAIVVDSPEMPRALFVVQCPMIPDVSEPIPLTARLRVPSVQNVVMTRARSATCHLVRERLPSEEWWIR
jgi:hypothetical protein